ncbi:hypothetical protein QBC46DRAFT_104667 [Diplogelasinospora grovesii]|uniref:Uncharacterized protein n=1 Tax=Diplogelasinospora grovesii TaxID=303347 RepID=A0AAN6NCS0_9PEZI|nr:hypothetical protein QBC46DRAFT_104667 [Diplogelasinospora grovesii]
MPRSASGQAAFSALRLVLPLPPCSAYHAMWGGWNSDPNGTKSPLGHRAAPRPIFALSCAHFERQAALLSRASQRLLRCAALVSTQVPLASSPVQRQTGGSWGGCAPLVAYVRDHALGVSFSACPLPPSPSACRLTPRAAIVSRYLGVLCLGKTKSLAFVRNELCAIDAQFSSFRCRMERIAVVEH